MPVPAAGEGVGGSRSHQLTGCIRGNWTGHFPASPASSPRGSQACSLQHGPIQRARGCSVRCPVGGTCLKGVTHHRDLGGAGGWREIVPWSISETLAAGRRPQSGLLGQDWIGYSLSQCDEERTVPAMGQGGRLFSPRRPPTGDEEGGGRRQASCARAAQSGSVARSPLSGLPRPPQVPSSLQGEPRWSAQPCRSTHTCQRLESSAPPGVA